MSFMRPRKDVKSSDLIASSVEDDKGIQTIVDTKIANIINKEVDKMLESPLERTNSGSDLNITAPLRLKKREYRSQEALPFDETITAGLSHKITNILPSQSEVQINDLHDTKNLKVPRVSILHENQRAEIIASVTERLYSKLKKKEEVAVAKMETLVDKKIVEPLSELRICTNARQRLIELSQRAIRNKRKVGVPAQTQTMVSLTRVKDQGIDIQSDLETYSLINSNIYIHKCDASTETIPMTPRYKEVSVGPKYGSVNFKDISTITDVKQTCYKNSCIMTEAMIKNECCTQTQIIPPPRRRKRCSKKTPKPNNEVEDFSYSPAISINISQMYPIDSESQSSEDNFIQVTNKINTGNVKMTPDLLTNHTPDNNENNIEPISNDNDSKKLKKSKANGNTINATTTNLEIKLDSEDFSDNEDFSLPRVVPHFNNKNIRSNMKEIILGRNKNLYPYNIVLSPSKPGTHSKRIVSFKDFDSANKVANGSSNNENKINTSERTSSIFDKKYFPGNNFSESETSIDSFYFDKTEPKGPLVWKRDNSNKTFGCSRRNYVPVYKSSTRHKTVKDRLTKEFLADKYIYSPSKKLLNKNDEIDREIMSDSTDGSEYTSNHRSRHKNVVKTNNFNNDNEFETIEKNILQACNDLELSVNKYKSYIETCSNKLNGNDMLLRTPTKYLQHLIKLRRDMIKTDQDNNKSSFDVQPN